MIQILTLRFSLEAALWKKISGLDDVKLPVRLIPWKKKILRLIWMKSIQNSGPSTVGQPGWKSAGGYWCFCWCWLPQSFWVQIFLAGFKAIISPEKLSGAWSVKECRMKWFNRCSRWEVLPISLKAVYLKKLKKTFHPSFSKSIIKISNTHWLLFP